MVNVSHDTIKVLKENIDRKISDIPCSNIFTNMSPRARDIKEIINKWDLIKIKSFCAAKEKRIKVKREPNVWENIFANENSDKGLISKIYKELTGLHSRKTNNPIKKMGKGLEQTLLQGGHKKGPETNEKMLSITSHQRDANLNHNEVPSHTGQSGQHKQINKQLLQRMRRKGNPSTLLVGMQTGAATVEHSMECPQKTKNGTAL